MTAPDPMNPEVGDRFRGVRHGSLVTVRLVDDDGAVFYRHDDGLPTACTAREFAAAFEALPEPLITEPMTLWRQTYDGVHSWSFSPCWGNAAITILPDGTWQAGHSS